MIPKKPHASLRSLPIILIAAVVLSLGAPPAVRAAPLLPGSFASLGILTPAPGAYTVNTTTLELTGPDTSFTGVESGGLAVFTFSDISIPSGATLVVTGTRPLALMSLGDITVAGVIDVSGSNGRQSFTGGDGALGGPGGHRGGTSTEGAGQGPGGGGGSNFSGAAAGGSFGGAGAAGATAAGNAGALPGPTYGDLLVQLEGGSGGGGASSTEGGGGGGAIQLGAIGDITVQAGGAVLANGGWGDVGGSGGAAGGSGGGILLYAGEALTIAGTVSARGGNGGEGGCCGHGGGGGGGRITLIGSAVAINGPVGVQGGRSGFTDTTNQFANGVAGPNPTGANGVIRTIFRAATTLEATSGTPQSTGVGRPFPLGLQVTVRDQFGALLSGVTVTFTAPPTGASARFGPSTSATAVTDVQGVAVAPPLTANTTAGTYTVTASTDGVIQTASFTLTNEVFVANLPFVVR